MAHVKAHYRTVNGKVIHIEDYDNKTPQGREASLHERTAVGKRQKGGFYLRATDAEDLERLEKAAKDAGKTYTKRWAGANHHGRISGYHHLDFDNMEDATAVHQELRKQHAGDHADKLAQHAEAFHEAGKDSGRPAYDNAAKMAADASKNVVGAHQQGADHAVLAAHHKTAAKHHEDAKMEAEWGKSPEGAAAHHAEMAKWHKEAAEFHDGHAGQVGWPVEEAPAPKAKPDPYEMGKAAHAKGLGIAPALNKEFQDAHLAPGTKVGSPESKAYQDAMKEYSKGWMVANLAEPVPGVTDTPEWKGEKKADEPAKDPEKYEDFHYHAKVWTVASDGSAVYNDGKWIQTPGGGTPEGAVKKLIQDHPELDPYAEKKSPEPAPPEPAPEPAPREAKKASYDATMKNEPEWLSNPKIADTLTATENWSHWSELHWIAKMDEAVAKDGPKAILGKPVLVKWTANHNEYKALGKIAKVNAKSWLVELQHNEGDKNGWSKGTTIKVDNPMKTGTYGSSLSWNNCMTPLPEEKAAFNAAHPEHDKEIQQKTAFGKPIGEDGKIPSPPPMGPYDFGKAAHAAGMEKNHEAHADFMEHYKDSPAAHKIWKTGWNMSNWEAEQKAKKEAASVAVAPEVKAVADKIKSKHPDFQGKPELAAAELASSLALHHGHEGSKPSTMDSNFAFKATHQTKQEGGDTEKKHQEAAAAHAKAALHHAHLAGKPGTGNYSHGPAPEHLKPYHEALSKVHGEIALKHKADAETAKAKHSAEFSAGTEKSTQSSHLAHKSTEEAHAANTSTAHWKASNHHAVAHVDAKQMAEKFKDHSMSAHFSELAEKHSAMAQHHKVKAEDAEKAEHEAMKKPAESEPPKKTPFHEMNWDEHMKPAMPGGAHAHVHSSAMTGQSLDHHSKEDLEAYTKHAKKMAVIAMHKHKAGQSEANPGGHSWETVAHTWAKAAKKAEAAHQAKA